jgi:hypothetical protein
LITEIISIFLYSIEGYLLNIKIFLGKIVALIQGLIIITPGGKRKTLIFLGNGKLKLD